MKIVLWVIVVCLVHCNQAFGQDLSEFRNTYQDAVELGELVAGYNSKKYSADYCKQKIAVIFKNYGLEFTPLSMERNPFLSDSLFADMGFLHSDSIQTSSQSPASPAPSSMAQIDAAKFNIESDSDDKWKSTANENFDSFLVKRFANAGLHFGVQRLINLLAKDSLINSCFPMSLQLINQLAEEDSGIFTSDITLIREIVRTEIEDLPKKLINSSVLSFTDEQKFILKMSHSILHSLEEEFTIKETLNNIALQADLKSKEQNLVNVAAGMQLMVLLSHALAEVEDSKDQWVDMKYKRSLLDEKSVISHFFYGLLYEQLREYPFFEVNKETFVGYIHELSDFVEPLNNAYRLAKNKSYDFTSMSDFMDYAIHVANATETFMAHFKGDSCYTKLFDLSAYEMDVQKYVKMVKHIRQQDFQRSMVEFWLMFGENHDSQKFRNLNFLVELALLKQPDQIISLLNTFIMPISSSSIKRASKFNISFNTYIGVTGGTEYTFDAPSLPPKGNIGMTIPIGFAITWNYHWTVLLSVLDLGSTFNLRLNDDSTYYSDWRPSHFFMPGAGVLYNLKKSPLSFGVNYSYAPHLRSYTDPDNTVYGEVSIARTNFVLLYDIPLFTLFNK